MPSQSKSFKKTEIVDDDNEFYYETYHVDQAHNGVIVFFPSVLPSYDFLGSYLPRKKWVDSLENVCLVFVKDPVKRSLLKSHQLKGSWFYDLNRHKFLYAEIALHLRTIVPGIKDNRVIFYGSSMGGYASISMQRYFNGSISIAECPQINLHDYHGSREIAKLHSSKFKASLDAGAKSSVSTDVFRQFFSGLSGRAGKISIIINNTDYSHIKYISEFLSSELYKSIRDKNPLLDLSISIKDFCKGLGHQALDKESALGLIGNEISSFNESALTPVKEISGKTEAYSNYNELWVSFHESECFVEIDQSHVECLNDNLKVVYCDGSKSSGSSLIPFKLKNIVYEFMVLLDEGNLSKAFEIGFSKIYLNLDGHKLFSSGVLTFGRITFILFKSELNFSFYILQYLGSVVGIYDYNSNTFFCALKSLKYEKSFKAFFTAFCHQGRDVWKYYHSNPKLDGFLLSTDKRPAHYFYEFLAPYFHSDFGKFLKGINKLISFPGSSFLSTDFLPCGRKNHLSIGQDNLLRMTLEENIQVPQLGFNRFREFSTPDFLRRMDGMLSKHAMSLKLNGFDYYPVVSFSVLGEEKSLKEQNEFIASAISKIKMKFSNPIFIFDGLTASEEKEPLNIEINATQREDVLSIISMVEGDFNFVDLHHAHGGKKLLFFSRVNFFFSSIGTDSMIPSRIFRLPGVCHSSPDTSLFSKHIYSESTSIIPKELSKYCESKASHLRSDKASYSIPIKVLDEYFWKAFNSYIL